MPRREPMCEYVFITTQNKVPVDLTGVDSYSNVSRFESDGCSSVTLYSLERVGYPFTEFELIHYYNNLVGRHVVTIDAIDAIGGNVVAMQVRNHGLLDDFGQGMRMLTTHGHHSIRALMQNFASYGVLGNDQQRRLVNIVYDQTLPSDFVLLDARRTVVTDFICYDHALSPLTQP
jgi:hypothetical protein